MIASFWPGWLAGCLLGPARRAAVYLAFSTLGWGDLCKTWPDTRGRTWTDCRLKQFPLGDTYTRCFSTLREKSRTECRLKQFPLGDIHTPFQDLKGEKKYAAFHQIPDLQLSMQKCVDDVKTWMTVNKLQLNDHKAEAMILSSGRKSSSFSSFFPSSMTVIM